MLDLHARLLAEIERREGGLERDSTEDWGFHHPEDLIDRRAYLGALRKIVELHHAGRAGFTCIAGSEFHCDEDGDCWPCSTMRSVARALGVEP